MNNYWFLGRLAPRPGDYYDDSPVAEVRTKTSLPRNKRNLLDTDEAPVTSDSEEDDECFLNIKSKKLALMRKCKASVQRSPESEASGTRHHSCTSSLHSGSLGFSQNRYLEINCIQNSDLFNLPATPSLQCAHHKITTSSVGTVTPGKRRS